MSTVGVYPNILLKLTAAASIMDIAPRDPIHMKTLPLPPMQELTVSTVGVYSNIMDVEKVPVSSMRRYCFGGVLFQVSLI